MRRVVPLDSIDLKELVCPWCGRSPGVSTLGLKTVRDGEVIGMIGAAESDALGSFYPRASVVITQLWVRREDRGELIGTQLVQALAARLYQRRHLRCIVAHGTPTAPTCQKLPIDWLENHGFTAAQARGQWRLDLRRTVRVPDPVMAALNATVRAIRPERPAPANRRGS